MDDAPVLLLLRHATAEAARPGHRDADRRLSPRGEQEADGVGAFLGDRAANGLPPVGLVLCSPALRTRQTHERLGLAGVPHQLVPLLYEAGSDQVWELAATAGVGVVLVVGHAPSVPGLVAEMTDPEATAPAVADAVATRFPPATLALVGLPGGWDAPERAWLSGVRLPSGRDGRYLH